jgi:hypothetical protein
MIVSSDGSIHAALVERFTLTVIAFEPWKRYEGIEPTTLRLTAAFLALSGLFIIALSCSFRRLTHL